MLKLTNITKDYIVTKELTVNALRGVSLDFRDNEFVSILGASGCGKTTLLNIIGGLDKYTGGDISIDNISTKDYTENQWNTYRNHRIGFVFQSYNLIPHQSVVENVELALTIGSVSKDERRQRAIEVLTEVGLAKELHKKPNQLSGGQMQRVAIARALVNNPEIILADEPTGALDSVTSQQVMQLLKKVAQKHLVIMVTHNGEIAEQFSTRIIKLSDGLVIDDSHPYKYQPTEQSPVPTKSKTKSRVKMSRLTALSLSFKNLLTKKGRTIMTSFAGSIGIIGVALVLALSNGFNMYIGALQSDTLSGYPVSVNNISADINAMYDNVGPGNGQVSLPEFPTDDNNIHVYDPTAMFDGLVHYNYLTKDYIDFVEDYYQADMDKHPQERTLNSIQYSYATPLNVFSQQGDKYKFVEQSSGNNINPMVSMMGSGKVFQEALDNKEFLQNQYDILDGHYPTEATDIAVIVDSRNRISISTLNALGIDYQSSGSGKETVYSDISFDEIMNKQFYVALNDQFYSDVDTPMGKSFTTLAGLTADEQNEKLAQLATDAKTLQLNVVGVMRVKEDAPLSIYSTGILHTSALTKFVIQDNLTSDIYNAQVNAKDNGKVYIGSNQIGYSAMPIETAKKSLYDSSMKLNLTTEQAYDFFWQQTSCSNMPTGISFYTTDFDGKDQLLTHLNGWNEGKDKANSIMYTDATEILSSTMGQMVDIISYVLIAFASISLLVSSVMIGIITYVSVIERTKEIGVLRSLGASKKDVSNVFNAESTLIGLTAGLIGIGITYLLSIPINMILRAVAGSALSTNLAILSPISAIVLVAISCLLTLISGSIPSKYAAKVDPVKALRAE